MSNAKSSWMVSFRRAGGESTILEFDSLDEPTVSEVVCLIRDSAPPATYGESDMPRNSTAVERARQFLKHNNIEYAITPLDGEIGPYRDD